MATVSIANIDLTIFDNNVFVIINHLKKQHKRANLDKVYNDLKNNRFWKYKQRTPSRQN